MPDIYDFADYIWLKRSRTVAWISANYSADVERRTRPMPFIVSANAAPSSTSSSASSTLSIARLRQLSGHLHRQTHGRRRLLSLAAARPRGVLIDSHHLADFRTRPLARTWLTYVDESIRCWSGTIPRTAASCKHRSTGRQRGWSVDWW